ncbi:hypothetical protein E3G68_005226 [Mycobacteroides abscessus]|nr:hypothetical protein [Mycobacteroides abscessus]
MLPSQPPTVQRQGNVVRVIGPFPCYLVCDDCVARLLGQPTGGRASNPAGVRDALRERYGDGYASWTSPGSLPGLLNEAAEYLSSREARDGVDFGTWQKMRELQQ